MKKIIIKENKPLPDLLMTSVLSFSINLTFAFVIFLEEKAGNLVCCIFIRSNDHLSESYSEDILGHQATLTHTHTHTHTHTYTHTHDRLGGLVVKVSASRAEGPGFESRLRRDFSGSSHTSDLKIGTPVATLPGAWRYRVSSGTGRPGVSIL